MYIAPRASVLWFLPVLMLSVYTWGYFWLAYIRRSNVSVPAGSGRYRVYQSLGSHILSTTSRQINGKEICNWNAWVVVIQFNYKYKVIHSLLIILPLNSEVLPSFHTSVFHYSWTNSDMKRWENHNGFGFLRVALIEEVLIWDDFCKIWWKTNRNRWRSRTKDYWLHSENRSQATCQILGNYSRQSFRAWRSPGCIAVAGRHDGSSEGNSDP